MGVEEARRCVRVNEPSHGAELWTANGSMVMVRDPKGNERGSS